MKYVGSSRVFIGEAFKPAWLGIRDGKILEIRTNPPPDRSDLTDFGHHMILPGIVDTHVHINEPGRTDWEGFETATQAAAAGGITTVVDMPLNCIPATTSRDALDQKLGSVKDQLYVDCGFWGGVTPASLGELPALLAAGVLGVKSFLIESGVEEFPHVSFRDVELAMPILREAGLPYLFHAEWQGVDDHPTKPPRSYAEFEASRPSSWEDSAISRLIELCEAHRCRTHIVHLSAASALPMIRAAKSRGLPLTVETCPHYLCFTAESIDRLHEKETSLFKCCPPIRSTENCDKLWQAVTDGTIDFIVSDHSPCTVELKQLESDNLDQAWGGIMGLQAGFQAVVTEANRRGASLAQILPRFTSATAQFIGLNKQKGSIKLQADADFVVFDPAAKTTLRADKLCQKNKASPYAGMELDGSILQTYLRGQLVYDRDTGFSPPKGKTIGVRH